MKSITTRTPHESSFSLSRRHFHWIIARVEAAVGATSSTEDDQDHDQILGPAFTASDASARAPPRRARGAVARIRSALAAVLSRGFVSSGLAPRLIGTLYGPRRGNVRFAFQADARESPALVVEVEMQTGALVKEMASGVVRVALECERKDVGKMRLAEERQWRAYCNGRKCGLGMRKDCGEGDLRVLRAVEMVTMGAGVLPAEEEGGEVMYMRARFERVVGSKDSEAFYMINPDGNGSGTELSIYFLRA